MKNIKLWMIIIVIVIIIITAMILFITKNYLEEQQRIETGIDDKEELKVNIDIVDKTIKFVDNRNEYFAVQNCINKYLENIVVQNGEVLYNLLDNEYIKENNITINNVLENISEIGKYYDDIILNINKMYTIKNENDLCTYFVYGEIAETYEDEFDDFYIIVRMDKTNDTFSILPYSYMKKFNYLNLEIDDEVTQEFEHIQKNEYNSYTYENINDEDMAKAYFYDYTAKMQYNEKKAYELLDQEYKEKRFNSFDKFNNYVKGVEYIRLDTYSVKNMDNYVQYICKDAYGREYIFKETSIMQYKVALDNYTLDNEFIRNEYAQASNKERSLYNVSKFFQMLNMGDYESAYGVLDESFKQNYFKTQADFENYIKQQSFKYNKVSYNQYSNKISSLHIYNVSLTDITEKSQGKFDYSIIVKLLDDINFKISFEIE